MTKKILLSVFLLPAAMAFAQQYGGMWIPTELNEKEMKDLGMKISAKDIFNPQKPSIKMQWYSLMAVVLRRSSLLKDCYYQSPLWIWSDSGAFYRSE
jgi:hypothetical protein